MILLIDNYDSFTYNLAAYLRELKAQVSIYRHDQISLHDCQKMNPSHLVISPGPGSPNEAGISIALIQQFSGRIPILGICLGHQCIAQAFGAHITHAVRLMHGKLSTITHQNSYLFHNLPKKFRVTRYHSLAIEACSMPDDLLINAKTEDSDQEIMAISHRHWPIFGLQFHPEAVLTEYGHQLLHQFCQLTYGH